MHWVRVRRALLAGATVVAGCRDAAGPGAPGDLSRGWTAAAAADVGLDSAALREAADSLAAIPEFRALLVSRHHRLVLERYGPGVDAATLFDVRSVTKSVVSTLTGIALREGALPQLDATLTAYLTPRYTLDATTRTITVRDLLTQTSGFTWSDQFDYSAWLAATDHVQALLDHPHASVPGEAFNYNTAAVHLLGVVVAQATGEDLSRYAVTRLLVPLGVHQFDWERLSEGTVNGGAGFALTGRDLLSFGQLMLQNGWSGDLSVVPEGWVHEATQPRFSWRTSYGDQHGVSYGYLWWVADGPPAAFFAWGFGGQFVYVVPALDLVIVTTTDWHAMSDAAAMATSEHILGIFVRQVLPAADIAATAAEVVPARSRR